VRAYADLFSQSVIDLHVAVAGLGLLYVAFVFTRWTLAVPELLYTWEFWGRVLAFFLVLLFAVFQAVTYDVHLSTHKSFSAAEDASTSAVKARPLVAMFIADMVCVGASAAMFATVTVTPLDADWLKQIQASGSPAQAIANFRLDAPRGLALLVLSTIWAGFTVLWYAFDRGSSSSLRWHGSGCIALLIATAGLMVVHNSFTDASIVVTWGAVAVYATYVAVLLMWRAPAVIRDSLAPAETQPISDDSPPPPQ